MTIDTIERVVVTGPRGALHGRLAYPDGRVRGLLLLCSPHPYMGGSIENNVIRAVADAAPSRELASIRFDYSGAGASEGPTTDRARSMASFWATNHAPEDSMFLEDARAVLKWARNRVELPTVLFGYSFGAHVAVSLADKDAAGLILLSPTILQHDFSAIHHLTCPRFVIQSRDDFATPHAAQLPWLAALPADVERMQLEGGNHFYRGMEPTLATTCCQFALACLGARSECLP